MYVTVPLKDICLILLIIALIVMVIYLIKLFRDMGKSARKSVEIMEDIKTITEIAEKRTVEIDNTIGNVSESINTVSKAIKGQENVFKQLSNIAAAIMSIVGIITGRGKKTQSEDASEEKACENKSEDDNVNE